MTEFDGEDLDAQERRVRDLLRAAPDVGPMPDDVVARVDEALRAARPATPVASLAEHAERRRSPWRARLPRVLAAAAGIVVVGGGALLVGLQGTPGADSGSSSAAGGGAVAAASPSPEEVPPSAQVLLSGRDYADAAAVQDLGEDVVEEGTAGGQAADATGPQGRAADATPGAGATDRKPTMLNAPQSTEGPTAPPATADESQRAAAERALACTKQLGVAPDSVLAVEIASWRSQPAALVVHTTTGAAEVVVVALDCTPGDAALSTVPVP